MKLILHFARNFLVLTFRHPLAYVLHFLVPPLAFSAMFFLLSLNESYGLAASQAIGMVLYFSMIQAVLIVSRILADREQGVSLRVEVAPVPLASYVLGNGLAAMLIMTVQLLLLSLFVARLFPLDLGFGFAPLALVLGCFSLTSIAFAFVMCELGDTASGVLMVANVVVLFSSLLGGAFIPANFMGQGLQRLAPVFPQYWAMRAVQRVQADGNRLPATEILMLLLFALCFLALRGALQTARRNQSGLVN